MGDYIYIYMYIYIYFFFFLVSFFQNFDSKDFFISLMNGFSDFTKGTLSQHFRKFINFSKLFGF